MSPESQQRSRRVLAPAVEAMDVTSLHGMLSEQIAPSTQTSPFVSATTMTSTALDSVAESSGDSGQHWVGQLFLTMAAILATLTMIGLTDAS